MPGKRKYSLEVQIRQRIIIAQESVFLRSDFNDLEQETGYDQIGRVLLKLVRDGTLSRAGYGVYVRTRVSKLTGKMVPDIGMRELATQAMTKLKVPLEQNSLEQLYNRGETTQVPNGRVIKVKSTIQRKLYYGTAQYYYEKA
jgi:hypothetical protein